MNIDKNKIKILIVDDTIKNIQVLGAILRKEGYSLMVAQDGLKALEAVDKVKPDLILLDIMMPGMDGFEACKRLKSSDETKDIPIIFLTAKVATEDVVMGFELGGVDYITKPFNHTELLSRVDTHVKLRKAQEELENQNVILEQKVKERTKEIRDTQKETLIRLTNASEMRDTDTGMHIRRIQGFTELMATLLGMDDRESEELGLASMMHDIGKIGIPDGVLLKPGKLTDDEWKVMITHPVIGAKILSNSNSKLLQLAELIALNHHERWDGKGYPSGLEGENIPLAGRIVNVVDVFDALMKKRPYKEAWPEEEVFDYIQKNKGTQFDPSLVDLFLDNKDKFLTIIHTHKETETSVLENALT